METAVFKKLLTDLYTAYNPDKLSDIDRIANSHNGTEFDAIKTIYLKYNFKQSPFYNPALGTDRQIKALMEKYNSGNMRLEEEVVEKEQPKEEEKKQEEAVLPKMPFTIILKFNFEESSELVLPDLSNFLYVSVNQRILFKTKSGGLIGVEVIDVMDDYYSNLGEPTREIVFERK